MDPQQPDQSPIDGQLAAPPAIGTGQSTIGGADRTDGRESKSGVATLAESRGMVLVILFGVTGALGIPLLWMNKRFSLAERIFWSIVVMIYTTALVGVTAAIVMWAYRMIVNF